ncbi:hypothetical protein LCGC14_2837220 [marine sediment metagenome]|uniref:Uncharacterized protein n=1 Tax=marine sediment metagenome TaxID=412755 RepID=A0A0F8YCA6_9ZZZZ
MSTSKIGAIKKYFGLRDGDNAGNFMKEIKTLDADERLELAQGSAMNLGLTPKECDFPLE